MQPQMTTEEAVNIIKQACASVNAPLATHQQIQTAVGVVEGWIFPVEQTVSALKDTEPKKK